MKKQITLLTNIRSGLLVMMLCFSLFTYAENKGEQLALPGIPESTVVYQGELVPYAVGNDVVYQGTIRLTQTQNFLNYCGQYYVDGTYNFWVYRTPSGSLMKNVETIVFPDMAGMISANYEPSDWHNVQNSNGIYTIRATGWLHFQNSIGSGSITLDLEATYNDKTKQGSFTVSVRDRLPDPMPPVE